MSPSEADDRATILTPDQRLRVFVSSTLTELASERAAATRAVERLGLTPVLFELGARPHPPRMLYRAYLDQSQIFVGIYWQSYGWTAPDRDVSGIEDEYRLSRDKPRLLYVKQPAADIEPRLARFLADVEADGSSSYRRFEKADELEDLLAGDLAMLLSEGFGWSPRRVRDASGEDAGVEPLPLPLTPLIGRERELEDLSLLLADPATRLLTITGAGGAGKSRLALEAARRRAAQLAGGAAFVDLGATADAALVVRRVAHALRISAEGNRPLLDTLVERLRQQKMLLLIDNFDRVTAAGIAVASILEACPGVAALVTSRVPLCVRGEREYRALPLPTPPGGTHRLAEIAAFPAVTLFVDRAADAAPGFHLTEANAADVAEICRRLDGLPLAMELAAPHIRVLGADALLERLAERLDLPSRHADLPERQQTLRATLDWSHALLDESEQALFARLAVFSGGWTFAAAEAVCGADDGVDVLSALSSLVEKSLVAVDSANPGGPRFRLLETIRDYAAQQEVDAVERGRLARRHGRYFTALCEEVGPHLYEPAPRLWFARLDADRENIRAFSRWALAEGETELLARAWTATWLYWWARDEVGSTRTLLEQIVPLPETAAAQTRGSAAWMLGMCVALVGQAARARELFAQALTLAERARDEQGTVLALSGLGAVAGETGGPAGAWAFHERALAIAKRLGWRWGIAYSLHHFGDTAVREGDGAAVITHVSECLAIAQELESHKMTAMALWMLGWGHILEGDLAAARESLEASVVACTRLGSTEDLSYCLDGFGTVALAGGDAARAARLAGAADGARERIRIVAFPPLSRLIGELRADAAAALGGSAYAEEHRRGVAMTIDEALALAVAATDGPAGIRTASAAS